jgi:hypothetical protein
MTTPGRGVAVVFGNERRGVSRAFIERADHAFFLPMAGLTQSFNISVAAAMSLYALLATGHFPEGTLSDDERTELLGRWLLRDVRCAFCETQPCCTPCRGARSHSAPASRPRGR